VAIENSLQMEVSSWEKTSIYMVYFPIVMFDSEGKTMVEID